MDLPDDEQDGHQQIGVIAANTGFGNGGKAQLEKYASKYGITIAVSRSTTPTRRTLRPFN